MAKTPATEGYTVKNFFHICLYVTVMVFSLASCHGSQEQGLLKNPITNGLTPSTIPLVQTKTEVVVTDSILNKPRPSTLDERFSYTYGYMVFSTMIQQGFDNLDSEFFAKGALDASTDTGYLSQDEMVAVLYEVQNKMLTTAQREQDALASENLEHAVAFLTLNKVQKDVHETDSGLQYRVLVEGQGAMPSSEGMVEVDYQIGLLSGQIIDSSYERGHSSRFQLEAVGVPGFIEGVKLMNVGSKYEFWIHPNLAYGREGTQNIAPNSLLVVQVELRGVESL